MSGMQILCNLRCILWIGEDVHLKWNLYVYVVNVIIVFLILAYARRLRI